MKQKFTGIVFGLDFDGTCVLHKFPEAEAIHIRAGQMLTE